MYVCGSPTVSRRRRWPHTYNIIHRRKCAQCVQKCIALTQCARNTHMCVQYAHICVRTSAPTSNDSTLAARFLQSPIRAEVMVLSLRMRSFSMRFALRKCDEHSVLLLAMCVAVVVLLGFVCKPYVPAFSDCKSVFVCCFALRKDGFVLCVCGTQKVHKYNGSISKHIQNKCVPLDPPTIVSSTHSSCSALMAGNYSRFQMPQI